MYYVYLIQSVSNSDQILVGYTEDLAKRLVDHNSESSHHTKQHKPWEIVAVVGFEEKLKTLYGKLFFLK